jgi:hypothetical protein
VRRRIWRPSTKAAFGSSSSPPAFRCSPEKPHGLDYSLTLHSPSGERPVGFDNAHPVGRQRTGKPQDHRHRLQTVRSCDYQDAATLLADFWQAVDAVLNERRVIP